MKKFFYTIALLSLFGAVWIHFTGPAKDPDFFWHLATGKWIVENGQLPETDPFSFSPVTVDPTEEDAPRIRFILRSYWLAQSFFYQIYQLYGHAGLVAMKAIVLTLSILAMFLWMRRYRVPPILSLTFMILTAHYLANTPFKNIRPQMFTFAFVIFLVYLLEEFLQRVSKEENKIGRWKMIFLPLLMLVWSNMHGGVIIGDAIILLYLGSETVVYLSRKNKEGAVLLQSYKRFLLICLVSLCAGLFNPETYHSLLFVLNLETTSQYSQVITEYMSPLKMTLQLHQPLYQLWIYLVLGLIVHLVRRRHIPLRRHLLFLFLAAIALKTYRYSIFVVLIEPLFIGAALKDPVDKIIGRFPGILRKGIVVPLIFTLIFGYLISWDINKGRVLKFKQRPSLEYPSGAVKFIKARGIEGNAFNTYDWGGYLIWNLYPQVKVLLDGRGLVERLFWDSYKVWYTSRADREGKPEWKWLLDDWEANMILMRGADLFSKRVHPLLHALVKDPDWALVYSGFDAVLFLKRVDYPELVAQMEKPGNLVYNQVVAQAEFQINMRPYRKEPWILMAEALLYQGKTSDAIEYYRKALSIEPGDEYVLDIMKQIEASQK